MPNPNKPMQIKWKNLNIQQVFHSKRFKKREKKIKWKLILILICFFFIFLFISDVHKVRPALHCGYSNKPLEKYDPNSYRSRMPLPDVKMPSKNASQIELGERK